MLSKLRTTCLDFLGQKESVAALPVGFTTKSIAVPKVKGTGDKPQCERCQRLSRDCTWPGSRVPPRATAWLWPNQEPREQNLHRPFSKKHAQAQRTLGNAKSSLGLALPFTVSSQEPPLRYPTESISIERSIGIPAPSLRGPLESLAVQTSRKHSITLGRCLQDGHIRRSYGPQPSGRVKPPMTLP